MTKQPNFLFFITDQQRADWLGCYGHPIVKTPNIDAIAAKGTRFDNFYVASPICMPNRASLMTGRFPSVHRLRYNGCALSLTAHTFADVLAAAGYHTAAIGKSHLQPFLDVPPIHDVSTKRRLIEEAWRPDAGCYAQEEPGRYTSDGRYEFPTPYYGFDHVDMVTEHGDRCGGHYLQWFKKKAPNWAALHDRANQLPHNYTCPQAYRTPVPEELYPTAYVADRAVEYLHGRKNDDQPFFAFVSFPDPHHPFTPPGKYWDMYAPDQFELSLPYSAHHNPPPPLQWLKAHWEAGGTGQTAATAIYAGDEELLQAMALTAGMIACVDDAVGRVIAALQASGHYDNTVICFNSDHGDYLGDFNLLLKGLLPFRSITRVPFIWSDPNSRTASATGTLASTVDIAATILARAGLQPYNGMQGESFLATIEHGLQHRDEVFIEYSDLAARLGFAEPARVRAVITRDWRYTFYRDQDWGELYDLRNDLNETLNLWADRNYHEARFQLAERLNHHLTCQMDESPLAHRLS